MFVRVRNACVGFCGCTAAAAAAATAILSGWVTHTGTEALKNVVAACPVGKGNSGCQVSDGSVPAVEFLRHRVALRQCRACGSVAFKTADIKKSCFFVSPYVCAHNSKELWTLIMDLAGKRSSFPCPCISFAEKNSACSFLCCQMCFQVTVAPCFLGQNGSQPVGGLKKPAPRI